ncbi:MAG: restriction endonuclease subunit S [Gammaproteobacteria bacterium]|nr:restriction endonuclease subunit S [Gammaproteobacteria bacterium]
MLVADGNHGEYRPRSDEFGQGEYAFIRAADMDDGRVLFDSAQRINDQALARIRKGVGHGGDVLFSHKGTVGKLALVPLDAPPFVCSPQTTFWRTLDEGRLDRRYLYYFMRSRAFKDQWMARSNETDMAAYVSLTAQRQLNVALPEIDEQLAIAGVLGALDDKIAQNRRTARALERLARAIFRAWFVDFEPVKAKVAGADSFPSMPQDVFDALPTQFVGSEIGPVPKGWEVKTISESIHLTMGQSPPSEFYNEIGEGLPFHQGVTHYGFRFPTHRVYCTTEGRIAEPDDVLLSVRAPVGRINVADRRLILGRGLAGLRHRSDCQSFLRQQISHIFAEEDAIGDGTIYKAVAKRFLEQMPLLSPPRQAREEFENLTRPLDNLIAVCEVESRKLAETRDLLLPQLLTGQSRVEVGNG